jgi:hypothetical protein
MKKKIWLTPRLIVLLRSRREEVLLNDCKAGSLTTGPGNNSQGCGKDATQNCGACQGRGGGGS